MGKIHELPKSSSRLLTSSQIISSVFCVVKELIENALDGGAKNVEVKLEDYGLEKIEVKDNGCGIDKNDVSFVVRPHFTSKITSYADLESINTYGFRGEALGAICAVADLIITSKTSEEVVGYTVNYSHDGQVLSTKPCPSSQGSTVSVLNLFKNIPVRRQYYRTEKNKKEDLRKIAELLISFGCITYDVRFALYHNKNLIWQKPALSSTKNALIHVLGNSVVDHLKFSEYVDDKNQRKFEIYLPAPEAPLTCGLSSTSRCITAINNRPVRIKNLDKLIKEYYNKAIQNSGKARYPICFISFTIPLKEVDINIEPNKTNVMLHHSEEIFTQFSEQLKTFYDTNVIQTNQISLHEENKESNLEYKKNASDFLDSLKRKSDDAFHQTKLLYQTDSPVTIKRSPLDKDIIVVNSNSSQKRENPIVKKDAIKEPSKKKLKTSFHVSKDDIQSHITSLKNFFSQDKTNGNMPLSTAPTVTVERVIHDPKSLNSDAGMCDKNNSISKFAVSTNICTENNHHVTVNSAADQKKPLFDSVSNIKSSEQCTKPSDINDAEAWSRGVHPSGGLFQPVKVLQPKTAVIPESSSKILQPKTATMPESSSKILQPKTVTMPESSSIVLQSKTVAAPESSFKVMHSKIVPELSTEAVSIMNTESKKETPEQKSLSFERKLTAFDIFCRSNRLEVAAQNPKLNNQELAQILSEKWSNLSSEEKAVYKNMLDKDYKQNVKKKDRLRKIVSQSLSQTQNKTSNEVTKKTKPKLKEKPIQFDTEGIKEHYKNKKREMSSNNELNIINYLAPGIWICSDKRKLFILNTFRLHETLVYHRLLETFQFESENLEKPLFITASNVGDEGMEVLMKLSKAEINRSVNIDDERLTANGFNIKVTKSMQNDILVQLIGLANNVAFYGIPDLKELLLCIKSKGFSASLSECRPGKIMLYLQGEANRMSRHSPPCQRMQDVEDLLNQNNFLKRYKECIHHKPFFNELWSFE